ncbi:hypothetical protein DFH08DRAFT_1029773 [Mycena albidolilacea]|uniref:Uncharacterized protein n=1 Tax=Mycena albidolilacea TaxID=1033008 RepID=A0AAD6ZHE0_9AGAR|nr:hypothetical protein DFH08DRAFT_1029773 [Mycena albidolilacea]
MALANGEDMDSDSPESCVPRVSVNNTAGVPAGSALQLAEAALAEVLGELQEAGVLQKKNMIDIKDFIVMPEEKIVEDVTNKEIFEAVQKMRANEQDREENSGDGEEQVDPKPSRKEALQATTTLCQYIVDLDSLFACKMEVVLSSFGRETAKRPRRW